MLQIARQASIPRIFENAQIIGIVGIPIQLINRDKT
jgi:hypothetical protein